MLGKTFQSPLRAHQIQPMLAESSDSGVVRLVSWCRKRPDRCSWVRSIQNLHRLSNVILLPIETRVLTRNVSWPFIVAVGMASQRQESIVTGSNHLACIVGPLDGLYNWAVAPHR